jgi:peroxiredoxin
VMIKATLSTRADVQHRCFVGQTLPQVETTDIDNPENEIDLGQLRGKTTVLALFRLDHCVGCGPVLDRISDGIALRMKGDVSATVLGVTSHADNKEMPKRAGFSSTVPIAVADERDYSDLTLKETDRIQVMVLDCRGIVRFVAPLAPSSDDLDAAVDEVLAAVEQADHLRRR